MLQLQLEEQRHAASAASAARDAAEGRLGAAEARAEASAVRAEAEVQRYKQALAHALSQAQEEWQSRCAALELWASERIESLSGRLARAAQVAAEAKEWVERQQPRDSPEAIAERARLRVEAAERRGQMAALESQLARTIVERDRAVAQVLEE